MRQNTGRLIILVLLVTALIAAGWYLSRPEPIRVIVKSVEKGQVRATVANTRAGTVNACRRARLSPATGGQIDRLPVREGDRVQEGELLLELWNVDLTAQVQLAERDAGAARARAEESCVAAQVAEREAKRFTKLRTQGLASEEDTDRATGEATARRAACNASSALIQVAQARVDVARAALERTRLRAPFEGTVAEINGELGEYVTPSPIGVPTPPAVDLIDTRCLYVTAPIDEVDAPNISAGKTVAVTLDAFPDRRFDGRVRRVAPYVLDIAKQARTVDIEVDFDNPMEVDKLLPGYSADVEIILNTREDVLRIPSEAVLEGHRVLVLDPGSSTLVERRIETGVSNWEYTEVLSGLKAGEQIVTSVDREGVEAGTVVVAEGKIPMSTTRP